MVILFALRYEREGRPQVNQLLDMLAADGNQQKYTVRASVVLFSSSSEMSESRRILADNR